MCSGATYRRLDDVPNTTCSTDRTRLQNQFIRSALAHTTGVMMTTETVSQGM